jgi:prepilin-type N-terminal cleavage/methylation domain-containing protein/prepilin-type processing-associated H-X9-DG protein
MKTAHVRSRSAFTLVELLIVVGIIAVLIAMLLPVLSKVREQGRQTVCLSNLHQLGAAMISYAADNDGFLPATARNAMDTTGIFAPSGAAYPTNDWLFWQVDRMPVYPNQDEIGHSALAKYLGLHFVGNGAAFGTSPSSPSVLRCPSDDAQARINGSASAGTYYFSYVMNYFIASDSSLISTKPTYTGTVPSLCPTLQKVSNPSQKALMYEEDQISIDEGEAQPWSGGTFNLVTSPTPTSMGAVDLLSGRHDPAHNITIDPQTRLPIKSQPGAWSNAVPNPEAHGNVVFCDGHAEFVSRAFLHRPDHTIGTQY